MYSFHWVLKVEIGMASLRVEFLYVPGPTLTANYAILHHTLLLDCFQRYYECSMLSISTIQIAHCSINEFQLRIPLLTGCQILIKCWSI